MKFYGGRPGKTLQAPQKGNCAATVANPGFGRNIRHFRSELTASYSTSSYAAGRKYEYFVPRPAEEITQLGCLYAESPDEVNGQSNPATQERLLELCQEFHPYLIKYLVMICRGTFLCGAPASPAGVSIGIVKSSFVSSSPKAPRSTRRALARPCVTCT